MLLKDIGKKIAIRRKELKLNIEDLSEYSGITEATISRIETGKANPTIKTIEKLLIPLGLTLDLVIIKRTN
ncbi:helix-turn-helix domain-containing protein [Arcobacter sp. YIC-310]|uniref:helix-turn-helix domain-containing protein n=1 Tax=Arcobacter sp. YIC-310 TaxID=3376632 RepID=UPI003C1C383C